MKIIDRNGLEALFRMLQHRGYITVGPTIRDGAIIYDRINGIDQLPIGWTDHQEGGVYRLQKRKDEAFFGYAVGPHSWKKYLMPPRRRLWKGTKEETGFQITEEKPAPVRLAFIGVRSCELHALAVQDQVLIQGEYPDSFYKVQRENLFIVAVNCGTAGGTCFCVSMKTGPQVTSGFDLVLTEVMESPRHYLTVESGTEGGGEILRGIPHEEAGKGEKESAESVVAKTAREMGREMETEGIRELLYQNIDHPRWDDVAARCLACGNCTMVCPTCFCTTVEEVNDLSGTQTEHWRRWDSCFTLDFSYLHGAGSIRSSHKARYRQWMTHKLATWIDQFGTSGCVGCGRCITWCPVAIDLTEEVRTIRALPGIEHP